MSAPPELLLLTGGSDLPVKGAGNYWGLLEEQYVLLSADSSLQPPKPLFVT